MSMCVICTHRASAVRIEGRPVCDSLGCIATAHGLTANGDKSFSEYEQQAIRKGMQAAGVHLAQHYKTFDMRELGKDGMMDFMQTFLRAYGAAMVAQKDQQP